MTKPRITAAMLRKRPKPPPEAEPREGDSEHSSHPSDAMHAGRFESLADNPSFRAPQFGIKPKTQPVVRVQHAAKRRPGNEPR